MDIPMKRVFSRNAAKYARRRNTDVTTRHIQRESRKLKRPIGMLIRNTIKTFGQRGTKRKVEPTSNNDVLRLREN
jgi:hypothetical protein